MKKITVLECKESSQSTPEKPLFRIKALLKDSEAPSFVRGTVGYINGIEAVDVDTVFEVKDSAIQISTFDWVVPEGDNQGEVLTLNNFNFI